MKERPIIMQAESVRAILDSRKTQTRRVIPADGPDDGGWWYWRRRTQVYAWREDKPIAGYMGIVNDCPYGQPGDRLWAKETWTENAMGELLYKADWFGFESKGMGWKSPRFMPRRASRIVLELTDVRVERVQDISEADAKAEGAPRGYYERDTLDGTEAVPTTYYAGFRARWDDVNGKTYPWESNPWVWCLTFMRVQP